MLVISQTTKRKPVVVAVLGIALCESQISMRIIFLVAYAMDFSPVAALFVISAMISCRLSSFATLSIPKRWRFPDRELTSGLL